MKIHSDIMNATIHFILKDTTPLSKVGSVIKVTDPRYQLP